MENIFNNISKQNKQKIVIVSLGLNHHTAPLQIREHVAFGPEKISAALASILQNHATEAVILSTCNRTEIYINANANANLDLDLDLQTIKNNLTQWLVNFHKLSQDEANTIQPYLQIYDTEQTILHIFRVISGLESMVLGEAQIVGQIKTALRFSQENSAVGGILYSLFQRAFTVAKEVRTQTEIGANIVSMAAAGVHLAERLFDSLQNQKILFIGAGEMIDNCAAHFCAKQPQSATFANRTLYKAQVLAEKYKQNANQNQSQNKAITLNEIAEVLFQHDIVISCTAAPLPIIGLGLVETAIKKRKHKPIFMVDLAVPRDIESEIADLDDVFLYTVDDLSQIVNQGREARQQAVEKAEIIVKKNVDEFLFWLKNRNQSVPLIKQIRENAEKIRIAELEHATKLLKNKVFSQQNFHENPENFYENLVEILQTLSKRLTNKFLNAPSQALQKNSTNFDAQNCEELIKTIFGIK